MKTIIITGAGSGLGKELAHLFSQKGYHLLLTGRNFDKLTTTKAEIEANGGSADILPIDIGNAKDVSKKAEEISHTYNIYGLVNNAGVGHFGPFVEMNEHHITEMINTNVLGTLLMTKAILPLLLKTSEGRILNIISTAGLRGKVNEAVYVASKFAIRGFTESLQKEYEGSGIKFNAVYMGGMDTPFWDNSDHVKDTSRFRSPREVAEMIIEQMDQDSIIIESKKS
ncbi:SDR family oxidoreductase [Bacillus sp. ISL-40]|uniref:SDR family NAD(P)-dependent oxidoreductase n=1 Tax=unclassified Bacillus (in: firmicutes) TaxID=185979 RepID=UPI001BE668C6|nr:MULTISPECIES: SDR family oxidoreductase [unclassified Bacillus (in: firmicutes)]MBT2699828.1 SDR family oxidoreductase [Bacillus sp. ISL-40]MBT2721942.1 SDR family oxidoreductase [Bacillus sp. ISL-46]MBT2743281.1 SDR family oxidoreductase [Bacillus sp. ISL-77]